MNDDAMELLTPEVIRLIRRLEDVALPRQTIDRWIAMGLVTPAVRRGRHSGEAHLWSAEDVVGLSFLARIRAEGVPVYRYRAAMRDLWPQLGSSLAQEGDLFFVAVGSDVSVVRDDEVGGVVPPPVGRTLLLWQVTNPPARIRAEAAMLRRRAQRRTA
ncbi:MAG: hypothetical protein FJX78_08195 [Armatimonadetes bacterium]|nr:hypothetical protein [Armatimonadota bacterium]